ncbi:DNA adenine methylase [Anaerosinus massiliensis]|uniref:DNA adenine methylase n=1 Tax=Massilibacillus massiliensis TaxID=1806837 RepID=UPI000AFC521A|nr:DNA adenine methylase [Massilibacillus massiliensis]
MMKPILRWPGSKWRMANFICRKIPRHDVYCEPFFGSGAVFFTKNPSGTETINDIDRDVVNLFRVVRNSADELARVLEMTPYSREEYKASQIDSVDEIEQARRFLVRTWQGFGAKTANMSGWNNDRTNQRFMPRYWAILPQRILETVTRLKMAQIEHADALDVIEMYNHRNALFYIDPPYLIETRTQLHYKCEFSSKEKHFELLELCRKHTGPCIISSYENDLYNARLDGWVKRSMNVAITRGTRTETIYLNQACAKEMSLFAQG